MNTLEPADPIEIPDTVVFQKIGEETVLLNLDTSIYFGLDEVGTRMWELLGEEKRLEPVIARLQEEYDVGYEALEKDVLALAEKLLSKGLIRREN